MKSISDDQVQSLRDAGLTEAQIKSIIATNAEIKAILSHKGYVAPPLVAQIMAKPFTGSLINTMAADAKKAASAQPGKSLVDQLMGGGHA